MAGTRAATGTKRKAAVEPSVGINDAVLPDHRTLNQDPQPASHPPLSATQPEDLEELAWTEQWQPAQWGEEGCISSRWCAVAESCLVLPTTLTDGLALYLSARRGKHILTTAAGLLVQYVPRCRSQDGTLDDVQHHWVLCIAAGWEVQGGARLLGVRLSGSGAGAVAAQPFERPAILQWQFITNVRRANEQERLEYARSVYLSHHWGRLLLKPGIGPDFAEDYVEDEDLEGATFAYFRECLGARTSVAAHHFSAGAAVQQLLEAEAPQASDRICRRVEDPRRLAPLRTFLKECLCNYAVLAAPVLLSRPSQRCACESAPGIANPNYVMHLLPAGVRKCLGLDDQNAVQLLDFGESYESAVTMTGLKAEATHWGCMPPGKASAYEILQCLRRVAPGRRVWLNQPSPGLKKASVNDVRRDDAELLVPLPRKDDWDSVHLAVCRLCGAEKSASSPVHPDTWWECSMCSDGSFAACHLVPEALHLAAIHCELPATWFWVQQCTGSTDVALRAIHAYKEFFAGREVVRCVPLKADFRSWLAARGDHELACCLEVVGD